MRKVALSIIAAVVFLFCGVTLASAQSMMLEYDGGTHEYNGEVYALVVNNQLLDPPLSPIIFNDRALVPVREIFEEVGATVNYIGETQTIEVISDDTYVTLRINDNVAYIDGKKVNIPDNVVPKLISKVGGQTKTMVPVRFISETIGLDVEFDSEDGAILIDSDGYTLSDENQIPTVEETTPIVNDAVYTVPYITDVSYNAVDDNTLTVTITADEDIDDYSDFTLDSPERIVIDFAGAKISKKIDDKDVGKSGISKIRLGDNDERARVVVDVSSDLKSYTVTKTSSNTVEVKISTAQKVSAPTATTTTTTPTAAATSKPAASQSSSSKLIVLDAGHGGSDSGAIGSIDGNSVYEKDLTLQITYRVKNILENAGYTVSMTRTGDTLPTLVERPTQANEENAALFVSIHINSADSADAKGTEVYYAASNNGSAYGTTSEALAINVLDRMIYYMGSVNRGVKTAEHAVTKRCQMPAVLAEVGFISNPTEVYNMSTDEYQQKAAQGIAEGIMNTLSSVTVPN